MKYQCTLNPNFRSQNTREAGASVGELLVTWYALEGSDFVHPTSGVVEVFTVNFGSLIMQITGLYHVAIELKIS